MYCALGHSKQKVCELINTYFRGTFESTINVIIHWWTRKRNSIKFVKRRISTYLLSTVQILLPTIVTYKYTRSQHVPMIKWSRSHRSHGSQQIANHNLFEKQREILLPAIVSQSRVGPLRYSVRSHFSISPEHMVRQVEKLYRRDVDRARVITHSTKHQTVTSSKKQEYVYLGIARSQGLCYYENNDLCVNVETFNLFDNSLV